MEFYFYDPHPIRSDKENICEFLKNTSSFLNRLAQQKSAFVTELYDDVKNALDSKFEGYFIDAIKAVMKAKDNLLEKAGLTGAQLKLKLRTVQHLFGELIAGKGKAILQKFFDAINNLLDSIAQVLNLHNAMKEIKDAVRNALA